MLNTRHADLKAVLTFIARASPDELAQVKSAVSAAEQFSGTASDAEAKVSRQNDVLLDIIVDFMTRQGVDLSAPFVLTNGSHYSTFKKKSVPVYEYVKPVGARNAQRALLREGVSLLFKDLQRMGLAVSSRLMMAHVHRIPAVLNRAYPGYRKIGAMKLILVPRQHGKLKHYK